MDQTSSRYRRPAPGVITAIRHAPPRGVSLTSRSGNDHLFHGGKYKWSARLTVINLSNK